MTLSIKSRDSLKTTTDQIKLGVGESWKDIIFLPFNHIIYSLFILITYSSVIWHIYLLAFQPLWTDLMDMGVFIVESLYTIYVIVVILHRVMKVHRQRKIHRCHPLLLILVDLVSLFPLGALYGMINRYTWEMQFTEYQLKYSTCYLKFLRIVRLYYFYHDLRNNLLMNQINVIIVCHMFGSFLIITILSAVYHYLGLHPSPDEPITWVYEWILKHTCTFDKANNFYWFVLSIYSIGGLYFNNALKYVPEFNSTETGLILTAMLLGFLSQYTYLLGTLTSEYLQGMRAKHLLQLRLNSAKTLMRTINMPAHFQKTLQTYYETIWNYRMGVVTIPNIINKLPPNMQNEIYTDMYWESLLHTKIFEDVSSVFRRMIARCMRTEIFVPGHFIYKEHEVKAKLVYIYSGMVEIFRMDTDDSRITLTSGTVLGEISCIHTLFCIAHVKCITNCTLHVLYLADLHKLLQEYPSEFKVLRAAHRNRIKYALAKLAAVGTGAKNSHVKWVKTQWRNIFEKEDTTFDPAFTSRFLDMIAMTNVDTHPDAFCLRGNCPFVMRTQTHLYHFFQYLSLFGVLFNFFYSFREIIFEGGIVYNNYKVYALLDTIAYLDIYIQIITSVKTTTSTIEEPYELLVYNLKNIYFIVDIVSTIPYDYFMVATGADPYYVGLARVPRFIKLYKVAVFFNYFEKRVTAYSGILKTLKFIVYHLLICLILTCVAYVSECFNRVCHDRSWITIIKEEHKEHLGTEIGVSDFLIAFYYTVNLYMKLVMRLYTTRTIPAIIVKNIIIAVSYYMLTLCLAQISARVGLQYESKHLLLEYVEMIDIYVREHKQLKKYKSQLLECLSVEWSISNELRFTDLPKVTFQESEFIRRNINDEYILWIMKQTEFFKFMSTNLLTQLAHWSDIFIIPEKHTLVRADERCFYLYIVVDGYCHVKSLTPGDWEKNTNMFYTKYAVFPLIAFMHQVKSLVAVSSYTAVQLLTIPYSAFEVCMNVFHVEMNILQGALKGHMKAYWGLLQRQTTTPYIHKVEEKVEQRRPHSMFEYKLRRTTLVLDVQNATSLQYGDSAFNTYRRYLKLIVTHTYSPNTRSYVIYEVFRCVCILIQVNLHYFLIFESVYNSIKIRLLLYLLYFLWMCDMFIQAHLDYYNEIGILVHGLKSTAKHYMNHAFIIDMISGLPYELLGLHALVREERRAAVEFLIFLNTRVFLLLRPLRLLFILQGKGLTKWALILKYFAIMLMLYHALMHLSFMKLLLTCDIDETRHLVCAHDSWMMLRPWFKTWKEHYYFWITANSVIMSGMHPSYTIISTFSDHILTFIIGILVACTRITLLCKIVGNNCIRQARLLIHQNALKRYNAFFSNRLVSNATKSEMLDHYTNIWKKSYAASSHKIFEHIYPYLRETLLMSMYQRAISKCILFQAENEVLFKLFIPYIEERYYKKNAEIIRTNDVQGNIYIVVKGHVEVRMADTRVSILGPGGIFGCFEPLGLNRQTIAVTAGQHVNALVIKSTRFYQLVKGFTALEEIMSRLRRVQFQYASLEMEHKTYGGASMVSSLSGKSRMNNSKYATIYKVYMYVTNVHIASINAIMVLANCSLEFGVMKFLPMWIIFDVYFCSCFFYRGKIPFLDYNTGLEVNKAKDLRLRYLKSLLFIVDVLSILPVYLIRIWACLDRHQIIFLTNKMLRIYYLYDYYSGYIHSKNVPRHLHWTLLVYVTIFLSHSIFILWWFLLENPIEEKIGFRNMIDGYIILTNFISSTAFVNMHETNEDNFGMVCQNVMVILGTMLTIMLAQLFTKSVLSENAFESVYRFRALFCKQFCVVSNVSSSLVTRTWSYFHYLYRKQGGEQFPSLYKYAPRYLKQDHMQSLFGKHFIDHAMFYDLHVDLLKQIQTHIKCHFYMPGATIIEKGHKNGKIYFIEKGNVVAIQSTGEDEAGSTYEVLSRGKAFGEIQAFLNIKHNRTYKALTPVDVIAVKVGDWEYLLDWFPASKQKLMSRVQEHVDLVKYY